MSNNYTLRKSPYRWTSAHQPIEFEYDMPFAFGSFTDNSGFVRVAMLTALAGGKLIVAGDLIYINGGIYKGYHVIKSVVSNLDFTLETAYISSQAGIMIKYATPPQWQIWKGYQDSEVIGTNDKPFTKVADIQPEGNAQGYITFNISGYIKSALNEITTPVEGFDLGNIFLGEDRSLWTPYRLIIGTNPRSLYFETIYYALNSSIEPDTLQSEYLSTNKPLNSYPFLNSCGATWLSFLGDNGVQTFRFENGGTIPNLNGFNNDFNNDFFNT